MRADTQQREIDEQRLRLWPYRHRDPAPPPEAPSNRAAPPQASSPRNCRSLGRGAGQRDRGRELHRNGSRRRSRGSRRKPGGSSEPALARRAHGSAAYQDEGRPSRPRGAFHDGAGTGRSGGGPRIAARIHIAGRHCCRPGNAGVPRGASWRRRPGSTWRRGRRSPRWTAWRTSRRPAGWTPRWPSRRTAGNATASGSARTIDMDDHAPRFCDDGLGAAEAQVHSSADAFPSDFHQPLIEISRRWRPHGWPNPVACGRERAQGRNGGLSCIERNG